MADQIYQRDLSRFVVYKNKKADTQSIQHVFIVLLQYGSSNKITIIQSFYSLIQVSSAVAKLDKYTTSCNWTFAKY